MLEDQGVEEGLPERTDSAECVGTLCQDDIREDLLHFQRELQVFHCELDRVVGVVLLFESLLDVLQSLLFVVACLREGPLQFL